ncbi:MAG: glycosyltransferase family 39 protein [Chitinophagales bacterium]|nr:glycosyltransferase family 39 protein [Chitinophagales bacterium]
MKKNTFILSGILLLKIILQFMIINSVYELHRDEYLYLAEGNNLAFGFIEVPPIISIFAWVIKVFGNSVFLIKLVPAVLGALMIVFTWKIVAELGGDIFAQVLASFTLLFSAFLRINMLFQPNSFDCLCWTILFYILIKWIKTQYPKYLYFFFIVVAVSFLNKYSIIFLMAGFFLGLFFSPYRNLFQNKHFYFALFLAFLLVSSNIYWQIQHGVPFLHHMLALRNEQLKISERMDFILDQLLFFIVGIHVVITGFFAAFITNNKKYRIIFLTVFFTLGIFICFKAKGYYAIGLYPVVIAFGSVEVEKFSKKLNLALGGILRVLLIVIPALLFLPFFKVAFPVLTPLEIAQNNQRFAKFGLLRWEDGKNHVLPQDFADMLGWKELTEKTQKIWNSIPESERTNTLIITDNYGEAGAINYYSGGKLTAHSSEASFALWLPEDMDIKNVISIGMQSDSITLSHFNHTVKADSITNRFAREYLTGIYIHYAAKPSFQKKIWLPYVKYSRDYYRYFK